MLVKAKLAPGKEDFIQDCCNRGKRPEFSVSLITLKQRDEEFLKPGMELNHKPPVFFNQPYQRKSKLSHNRRQFYNLEQSIPQKLRKQKCYLPQRLRNRGAISSIRYFKGMVPKYLRKTFLYCKTVRTLFKRLICQRSREKKL